MDNNSSHKLQDLLPHPQQVSSVPVVSMVPLTLGPTSINVTPKVTMSSKEPI